jgi:hypothetical protein
MSLHRSVVVNASGADVVVSSRTVGEDEGSMATASAAVLSVQSFLASRYDRLSVTVNEISLSLADAVEPAPGALPFLVADSVYVHGQAPAVFFWFDTLAVAFCCCFVAVFVHPCRHVCSCMQNPCLPQARRGTPPPPPTHPHFHFLPPSPSSFCLSMFWDRTSLVGFSCGVFCLAIVSPRPGSAAPC